MQALEHLTTHGFCGSTFTAASNTTAAPRDGTLRPATALPRSSTTVKRSTRPSTSRPAAPAAPARAKGGLAWDKAAQESPLHVVNDVALRADVAFGLAEVQVRGEVRQRSLNPRGRSAVLSMGCVRTVCVATECPTPPCAWVTKLALISCPALRTQACPCTLSPRRYAMQTIDRAAALLEDQAPARAASLAPTVSDALRAAAELRKHRSGADDEPVSASDWVVGEAAAAQRRQGSGGEDAWQKVLEQSQAERKAANADGHVGTLCCWALLSLSNFEPAQVRSPRPCCGAGTLSPPLCTRHRFRRRRGPGTSSKRWRALLFTVSAQS